MADPTASQLALAGRLRELRNDLLPGKAVTQKTVAEALGVSVALVSSWESTNTPTVPPEDRLTAYARFFATPRSAEEGLVNDLTPEEEDRRRRLIDDLVRLREEALADDAVPLRRTGALGGRFWHFPDGQPVRIITSRLSERALTSQSARRGDSTEPLPYSDAWHPNHIRALWDGDADATLEVYGHIRAENPTSDVRVIMADRVGQSDLVGHVVVLGQANDFRGNVFGTLHYMTRRLEWSWSVRLPEGADEEFDSEFVVTLGEDGEPDYVPAGATARAEEVHRPVFLRDESGSSSSRFTMNGWPQLEYDVAVLARRRNELNRSATVTVCSGIFSRGSYGAVRALTDPHLRSHNEQWVYDHVNPDDFWMLIQVPVYPGSDGAETVTPDLERPFHRLRVWSRTRATP